MPSGAAHQIANRDGLRDLPFHAQIHGEIFRSVIAGFAVVVAKIAVQRETIYVLVTLFENFAIPFEISGHERAA